jgi:Niemann-Pick C1 protein
LPSESYLVDYFNALDQYLDVGPPVYFVVRDIDVTKRSGQQKLCGRFSTCSTSSVANLLEAERKRPESSFISEPAAVWVDDFFQWLNPILETCCRVKRRDPEQFCTPRDSDFACKPCFEDKEPGWNITMEGLPEGDEFMRYLRQWLDSPADEECPLGGKAPYSSALKLADDHVAASNFRTYHTPLKSQDDYINALAAAKRVAIELSERTQADVFPYSIFYVFFDQVGRVTRGKKLASQLTSFATQYAHIVTTAREVVFLALLAVFVVTAILLGSLRTAMVVLVTVTMSVVNVMGVMGAWGISLNALSLVNLVIAIGISVEFCSHIARAFMGASGGGLAFNHPAGAEERNDRVWTALAEVGSSVSF